jgi:hypothetical protein
VTEKKEKETERMNKKKLRNDRDMDRSGLLAY